MIDRNDPTSAVLVRKDLRGATRGTRIIQKPYGANWASVSNALGITPSDAFFPPERVLIVEGTSDRLYVTRYMGLCTHITRADMNYLHIVDADRREEIPGTARLYLAAGSSLVVLVDADKGGDDFTKALKKLVKDPKKLQIVNLRSIAKAASPVSIEDLIPGELWFAALGQYSREILGSATELSSAKLLTFKKNQTLGRAAGDYLVSVGILQFAKQFSKTTVADFFCRQQIPVPPPDNAMVRLCSELSQSLNLVQ